jgi:L-aspartate oxidase
MTDRIVIVGGGIAGLATAIRLAPLPVTLIAGAPLSTGAATVWAQGGLAAAIGADDAPALHAADTLKAGAGIGDPDVAQAVAAEAPAAIAWLESLGAQFDRDASGNLALGLEAAHSRRRIVHAGGDGTGRAILATLIATARATAAIDIVEDARAESLVLNRDGAIAGAMARRGGGAEYLSARAVVLATGGIGGLYAHTTNPLSAVGSGLAMAARAGAVLRDVEFVQFHPTAVDLGRDPMPLATEALRGEGAVLTNGKGERFMADVPGAELAPRDVVARAIWRELQNGERVYLDGRAVENLAARFPSVTALCRDLGLDPAVSPIPVRPAAHYHMGGVEVDRRGRASIAGLWACGEVAATGLHGANRLASNSLIEALAFAKWIASDLTGLAAGTGARPAMLPSAAPVASRRTTLRAEMERGLGVIRDAAGIAESIAEFAARPDDDAALVGLLIAAGAWSRCESRGGHFRSDYPAARPALARPSEITLPQAQALAADLFGAEPRARRGR